MLCVKCGMRTAVRGEDVCYRCIHQELEPHGYGDDGGWSDGKLRYSPLSDEIPEGPDSPWFMDDDPVPDERLGTNLEDLFVLIMDQEREAEMLDRIDLAVRLG